MDLEHAAAGEQAKVNPIRSRRALGVCLALLAGVGLTILFWPDLWSGGGLVGGDIYSYFYPQKQYLAERLRAGELPWWNPRTGFGYPALGESQTGILYPPHWLYAVGPLNLTYDALQLAHYVVAFVGTWAFTRRCGLSIGGSLLAGLVYTYGWLPPRMSLEWAAIGAAWLPVVLWLLEGHLRTGAWRNLVAVSVILGMQMLAGHYQLAFLTQITAVIYWTWRIFWDRDDLADAIQQRPLRRWGWGLLFIGLGFGLAAIQLLPTWELKQLSQRAEFGAEHDPGYGYIPWWYLPQLVCPWGYYDQGWNLGAGAWWGHSRTNSVEAHLYCGLLPLLLALWVTGRGIREGDRSVRAWSATAVISLVVCTGALMPVLRWCPGFSFFNGVGRYSLLTTLSIAWLAGLGLDAFCAMWKENRRRLLIGAVLLLTTCDLWWVAGRERVVVPVPVPPLSRLEESPVREALSLSRRPVRLFSRGANLPNLLGVSSLPVYLGLSPSVYFDPAWICPQPWPYDGPISTEQLSWLRQAGVTHVLSFKGLEHWKWPVRRIYYGPDSFLNYAWGRGANEWVFLYELEDSPGRLSWQEEELDPQTMALVAEGSTTLAIQTSSAFAGTLLLRDLDWPGWSVTVDGSPAASLRLKGLAQIFRAVHVPAGEHQVVWHYRPQTLVWGCWISGTTLLFLAGWAHLAFWHPAWLARLTGNT